MYEPAKISTFLRCYKLAHLGFELQLAQTQLKLNLGGLIAPVLSQGRKGKAGASNLLPAAATDISSAQHCILPAQPAAAYHCNTGAQTFPHIMTTKRTNFPFAFMLEEEESLERH